MFNLTPARILSTFVLCGAVAVKAQASDESFAGKAFYFHPGMGACGYTDDDNSTIASVPAAMFNSDDYNGEAGGICACNAVITDNANGQTATVPIHEAFTDSGWAIGLSPAAFQEFQSQLGIIPNVTYTVQC